MLKDKTLSKVMSQLNKFRKGSGTYIKGFVEVFINGKKVIDKQNTVVQTGEDFIADLLSRSLVLGHQYTNDQEHYVDFISVGAGYKITTASSAANEVILPYDPVDGNEASDFYVGKKIKCISGSNVSEERTVTSYDNSSRTITVDSAFSNAPQAGDVYVIETDVREIQLQGEGQRDGNGNVVNDTRKEVTNKYIGAHNNEVVYECTWDDTTGAYVITESGFFYNVDSALDGNSSNHTPANQKMFARVAFLDNPIYKGASDEVKIKWTFRVGNAR